MSPSWVAVLVALLGIFASLTGLYWQTRRQWLLHSASTITTLLEQFNSEQFEIKRRRCAELAAQHLKGQSVTLVGNYGFGVLGFFEHIGHLVRRGALDEEMIWNRFAWEIIGYYAALSSGASLIDELRRGHPSHYVEFEWLHKRMVAGYRRYGDTVYVTDPKGVQRLTWMDDFLLQESSLGKLPSQRPVASKLQAS